MSVFNRSIFTALLFLITACATDLSGRRFLEMRSLPKEKMALAFDRLSDDQKIEMFFQAKRRHPPYGGLDNDVGRQGKDFLVHLRGDLDARGGMPEVLSFMGIVLSLKRQGVLSVADMSDLRINGTCALASGSQYCPVLEEKLLTIDEK